MKTLNILQIVMDIFFFVILFFAFAYLSMIIPNLFNPDIDFLIVGIPENPTVWENAIYTLGMVLNLVNVLLFIITLLNLRRIVHRFKKGEIYEHNTRKYFKYAGWATLIYGIIKFLLDDYWEFFLGEKELSFLSFNVDLYGFGSYLFIIVLGLLFIYLARILEKSDELQKENELTIWA